jgi:hypothetical protein
VPEQAIGELAEHIGAGGASFIQAVTCFFLCEMEMGLDS